MGSHISPWMPVNTDILQRISKSITNMATITILMILIGLTMGQDQVASTQQAAVTTTASGANVASTTQQVTIAPAKPASNSSACSSDAVSMTSEKVTTLLGTCIFAALLMSRNHLCC